VSKSDQALSGLYLKLLMRDQRCCFCTHALQLLRTGEMPDDSTTMPAVHRS
jgi:hypothetical protein